MNWQTRNGRRLTTLLFTGIILLAAAFYLISGQGSEETAVPANTLPDSGGPVIVGNTAINFTLNNLDGIPVRLSDHLGQPIILNFWASWCAPCRIEMPELQALQTQYANNGLTILAINQGETAETARAFFFDEMGLTFANPLLDENTAVAQEYGVRNLPTTIFINSQGQITAIHRGPATRSQFEAYLAQTN
jgi:thiol-disulfide isomerase/thioredoxin